MSDVTRVRSISVRVDWFEDESSAEHDFASESIKVVLSDGLVEWRDMSGTTLCRGTKEMMEKLSRVTIKLCGMDS